MGHKRVVGAACLIKRHRRHLHLFIADCRAIGRTAMIADDAQHVQAVFLEAGEGTKLLRHLG